ncbi:MAG: hypothetical protein U5K33_09375 [Halofilum sp. (in: g-proteobacteria)]|nr:hypothetical protein [Halofilum sp. (in: g-proteobacteria)]
MEIGRDGGLDGEIVSRLEARERVILQPGDAVEDAARIGELEPR